MTDARYTRLVEAAQHGDRRARDELIAVYLPLLYNIVRRALGGHADVDDVVQETLLRVVRDLPDLRDPNSFRPWLVAIAIRQIGSHRDRQRAAAEQVVVIDEAGEVPDEGAGFEDLTILRLQLSAQRRQIAEASRWLDADFRLLFSLWWQESAGRLSRAELADAMGLTVAHAGVRVQRMREQLELCRAVVAALSTDPRCRQLEEAATGWNGRPTSLWRKRIGRHVRDCPDCVAATAGQIPLERLLLTFAPLAVPVGLTAALAAKGLLPGTTTAAAPGLALAGATQITLIGKLAQAVVAHPLASLATGAVLAVGTTATVATWPESPREEPGVIIAAPIMPAPAPIPSAAPASAAPIPSVARSSAAPPSAPRPAAAAVPLGTWSLESVTLPGHYVTNTGLHAALAPVSASSGEPARQQATFTVVKGLADPDCVTFRAADGRYLRHYELRLRLSPEEPTELFRRDATFCPLPGMVAGSVSLQSHNYSTRIVRYRSDGIYIHLPDGTAEFARDSSFIARAPWAPA